MSGKKIDPAKEEFCLRYALLGDVEEAAVCAGFGRDGALGEGLRCLRSAACRKKIKSAREVLSDSGAVVSGLRRLAFGSCRDAVFLAFSEELPSREVIEELDLFNVSEIRRVKGGGVEIKLFDRLKAMEKLYDLECAIDCRGDARGLMETLFGSAKEVSDDGDAPVIG